MGNTINESLGINRRIFFVIFLFIILVLGIDVAIRKTAELNTTYTTMNVRISLFMIVIGVTSVFQVLITYNMNKSTRSVVFRSVREISILKRIMTLAQYFLVFVLISTAFEVIFYSKVHVVAIQVLLNMSYGLCAFFLIFVSYKILSWSITKKSFTVMMYGITSAMLAFNVLVTLSFVATLLYGGPPEIRPSLGGNDRYILYNSLLVVLERLFFVSSVLSFVFMWISTLLLLFHYSGRKHKILPWLAVAAPLFFFTIQYLVQPLNLFSEGLRANPTLYGIFLTVIFSLSTTVGGVLFGIAFWVIAVRLKNVKFVKDYLIVTAYGIVLLFASNHAIILISTSFPPFGIATLTFMSLAGFLFFVGLFASALSVSQDRDLRSSIRKSVENETRFLDLIGTAQMEDSIKRKVRMTSKKVSSQMEETSGIETSLSQDEIDSYVQKVIQEIKLKKKSD